MSEPMRVLTVRQPWAEAIARLGKDVENRSRPTKYRGDLAIHAGLTVNLDAFPRVHHLSGVTPSLPMYGGGVVAVVRLAGVHSADDCWVDDDEGRYGHCSPWGESGAFHWEIEDVRPLSDPFPLIGSLGLRKLPADYEAEIRRRIA